MDFFRFVHADQIPSMIMTAIKPFLTLIVWFFVDRMIRGMQKHTNFIDSLLTRGAKSTTAKQALSQRITTFKRLFIQILRMLVALFFVFVLLGNFGIDPAPLIAGIGVVGLGLSLAAQNILRDFLNGMFILIEDQYNVGDWVTINGLDGTVEHFTLRVTHLRRANGDVVIIPNSMVGTVINSTKNYAVAVITAAIPYDVAPDRATEILERCARIVRERKPECVIADGVVHGITEFRPTDMVMRMVINTTPGDQWSVERTARAVIREEFTAEGIEVAPTQIVASR